VLCAVSVIMLGCYLCVWGCPDVTRCYVMFCDAVCTYEAEVIAHRQLQAHIDQGEDRTEPLLCVCVCECVCLCVCVCVCVWMTGKGKKHAR
jgi:hypothetical protein